MLNLRKVKGFQCALSILLSLCLIVGVLPMAVTAQDAVYPPEGTALEDPYSPDYEEKDMYDDDGYDKYYEDDEYLDPAPGYIAIVPLNTIFVPHTGNAAADEAALRDAFAQGPGYTIELETGTWHLTGAVGIELQEGQTLIGNGSTIHASLDSGAVVLRSRVDNVTLSDFTLIRTGWGYGGAICIGGRELGGAFSPYVSDRSSNIVLRDITIQCDISGGPGGGYGISLHGVNSILMENLIFDIENMTSGIRIASSADVTIENLTIDSRLDVESIIFSYSPYYRVMASGDHDYSIRDFSVTGLNLGIATQPWIYLYYSPPWPATDDVLTRSLVDRFLSMDFETIHIEGHPYVTFLHSTLADLAGSGTFLPADMDELLHITLLGLGAGINGLIGGLPWFVVETGVAAPDNRHSGLIIEMDDESGPILFNWNTEVPGVTAPDPWPWGPGPYTTTGGDLFTNVTFEIIYTTDGSDPRDGGNIFDGTAATATNTDTIRAVGRITIRDNVSENYIVIFTELLGTAPSSIYIVTFSVGAGSGTIAATRNGNAIASPEDVHAGETVIFTATPGAGYRVGTWTITVDGVTTTFTGGSTRSVVITGNTNVVVTFVPITDNGNGGNGDNDNNNNNNGGDGRGSWVGSIRPITRPPAEQPPTEAPAESVLVRHLYLIGYEDGLIRPRGNITRAEVATIFFRLISDSDRAHYWMQENPFDDVVLDDWFNNAVSTTVNMGIFQGVSADRFEPHRNITRGELAAVMTRFFVNGGGQAASGSDQFNDIAGHWARGYINTAAVNGWVRGHEGLGGSFSPNQAITRAEVAAMINRIFERLQERPEDLLANMIRWSDNTNESAWYYLYIQSASNSYTFVWKDGGIYELWRGLITPRDWTVLERPYSRPGDIR